MFEVGLSELFRLTLLGVLFIFDSDELPPDLLYPFLSAAAFLSASAFLFAAAFATTMR